LRCGHPHCEGSNLGTCVEQNLHKFGWIKKEAAFEDSIERFVAVRVAPIWVRSVFKKNGV